jgi:peptidoglycan-N-acetylglucosamine deacetylase
VRLRRAPHALVAAAVLALSGCAVATDTSWSPPGWDESELTFAGPPEPLDAAAVPALVPQRLRNDAVGMQARFSLLPGSAPLNDRVLGEVRAVIGARTDATGIRYSPQAFAPGAGLADRACVRGSTLRAAAEVLADPALGPAGGSGAAVVCDVVAAAGTVFGQRVRVVSGSAGAVDSDTARILYTDLATGAVVDAAELWTPEAPSALWTALVDALRREAGALSLAPAVAPDEATLAAFAGALQSTVPGADGALVVTVPAGFSAPELAELGVPPTDAPLTVHIPPGLSAPLTSPAGSTLVAAVATAAPYQAPAPVPAGNEPVDCSLFPCVALTYDDGPSELTAGILDALAARHAGATFFVMGEKVKGYADLLRRAIAEGHEVENHTWNHPHLPGLPLEVATRQLRDTTAAIEAVTGEKVTMFRPPYGEYNAAVVRAAGLPAILWDVDTLDWQGPGDDELVRRAVDKPSPGSIVLQHDVQGNTGRTAAAVYDGLLDRGFRLVTVSQIFGGSAPAGGVWRSGR